MKTFGVVLDFANNTGLILVEEIGKDTIGILEDCRLTVSQLTLVHAELSCSTENAYAEGYADGKTVARERMASSLKAYLDKEPASENPDVV